MIFLMSISFICILLPILGFVIMSGNKVSKTVNSSAQVVTVIKNNIGVIKANYGFDIASRVNVSKAVDWMADNLECLVGSTFHIVVAVALMYFICLPIEII